MRGMRAAGRSAAKAALERDRLAAHARDARSGAQRPGPAERHKGGTRRQAGVDETAERPPGAAGAAALSWAAAASAREWLATIRLHAAWTARSAAHSAEVEADEAVLRAAEDGRRVVDAQGMLDVGAVERVAEELRRASDAARRAARSFRRSSRLDGAAASEQARAERAGRRAGAAAHATSMGGMGGEFRKSAEDAARQAADAKKRAAALRRDADRAAANVSMTAMAAAIQGGSGIGADALRGLSLTQADMWEDAKQNRLDSAAAAGKVAEAVVMAARARRLAAAAARTAAGAAAAAEAENGGGGDDPKAKRAAAAWRRAMAAANRADAKSGDGDGGGI